MGFCGTRKIHKKLTETAMKDRANLLTEKDVEILKSVGAETDLETLRNESKRVNNSLQLKPKNHRP